jgi:hypothetical protein
MFDAEDEVEIDDEVLGLAAGGVGKNNPPSHNFDPTPGYPTNTRLANCF